MKLLLIIIIGMTVFAFLKAKTKIPERQEEIENEKEGRFSLLDKLIIFVSLISLAIIALAEYWFPSLAQTTLYTLSIWFIVLIFCVRVIIEVISNNDDFNS